MNNSEFTVTVRNTEPLIKRTGKSRGGKFDALIFNIAAALVLEAALIIFLMMGGLDRYILYTAPAPILFLVFSLLEKKLSGKNRLLLIAVTAIILVVAGVVFRKYFFNGFKLMMNQLYDYGEAMQAYIYTRFDVGDTGYEDYDTCLRVAIALISAFIGLIAAFPRERMRVEACTAIFVAITLLTAYYGLLPARAGVALIIGAIVLLLSKGRIISALPVLIAVGIIFSAIMTINPGESFSISRVDENLRDRIALGSVQLESDDVIDQEQDFDFGENSSHENNSENVETSTSNKVVFVSLIILIPVLIILILALLIHRRLERKRKDVRAGLNSTDRRTAVTAMFPYAMKWLRSYGVSAEEGPGVPFSELLSRVEVETNEIYAAGFKKMNDLWKKAAYSDHDISEADLFDMRNFMNETVQMTKSKVDFKEKLKIRFKYAL